MKLGQPKWTRRLPRALVVGAATLGPLGARLPAPGTWGSLAGLLYFAVFFPGLSPLAYLLLVLLGIYLSIALCGEAEIRLGRTDPGEVILDEFISMPLCFLGYASLLHSMPRWAVLLGGFGLFRLFDILKPLGIRRLQVLPGGWGVTVDDLAAALAACASLHLLAHFWSRL